MRKQILLYLLALSVVLTGCETEQPSPATQKSPAETAPIVTEKERPHVSVQNPEKVKRNLLAEAEKNYLDSYNEYVRCLRESGPQTIQTLQALTVYQKEYQIYQMLLNAKEENK